MLQICPKCGKDQGTPAAECRSCGIVFAKYRPRASSTAEPEGTRGFEVYAPTPPKKKRSLLKLLLMLGLGAFCLAIIGILSLLHWARGSEPYARAAEVATGHPAMIRTLGEPIEIDYFFPFTVSTSQTGAGPQGSGWFTLTARGPEGGGVVVVALTRVDDQWVVRDAVFGPFDGVQQHLVRSGRTVGGDIADRPPEPEAAPGLTAEQLLGSNVETFGEPPPATMAKPEPPPAVRPGDRARAPQPPCPYTGSTSGYVDTIKPSGMRSEVSRSTGCLTLVVIWGAWCPTCRKHYPYVAKLAELYRPQGLAVHSFSTDQDPAALEEFLGAQPSRTGTFRLALDPNRKGSIKAGARDFGADYPNSVPFYALFDRDHRVLVQGSGSTFKRLEPQIRAQLN